MQRNALLIAFFDVDFKARRVAHLHTALFGHLPLLPTNRPASLLDDHLLSYLLSASPQGLLFCLLQPPDNFLTGALTLKL